MISNGYFPLLFYTPIDFFLNVSDYVLSLGLLQSAIPELKPQQFRICPLFPLVCNGQDYGT